MERLEISPKGGANTSRRCHGRRSLKRIIGNVAILFLLYCGGTIAETGKINGSLEIGGENSRTLGIFTFDSVRMNKKSKKKNKSPKTTKSPKSPKEEKSKKKSKDDPDGFDTAAPISAGTSSPSSPPTSRSDTRTDDDITVAPSMSPTRIPSAYPSAAPSIDPSAAPSAAPSVAPSTAPSGSPTKFEVVDDDDDLSFGDDDRHNPGDKTKRPSSSPTGKPSASPSKARSGKPSASPTGKPSASPSKAHSGKPSASPTGKPSTSPSKAHSGKPSASPSARPSGKPSISPSPTESNPPYYYDDDDDTLDDDFWKDDDKTNTPSEFPSGKPSSSPSASIPPDAPEGSPITKPSSFPSSIPSSSPSSVTPQPSLSPSSIPSSSPSSVTPQPSSSPSSIPSSSPSSVTPQPSYSPSSIPSSSPSSVTPQPSSSPSSIPSGSPSSENDDENDTLDDDFWKDDDKPSESPSESPSKSPSRLGSSPFASPSVSPTSTPSPTSVADDDASGRANDPPDVDVEVIVGFELVNVPNDEEFTIENCNILEIVVNNWLTSYFDNTRPAITDIETSVQKHILALSQSSVRRNLEEEGSSTLSSLYVDILVTGCFKPEPGLYETANDVQFDVKVKKYLYHVVPNRKLLQSLRSVSRYGYYSNVNEVVLIEGDIQDYIINGPMIPWEMRAEEEPSNQNIVASFVITSLVLVLFVGGLYIFEVGKRYKCCGGCNWSARPRMFQTIVKRKKRNKSEVLTDPSSIISDGLSSNDNEDRPLFPVPVRVPPSASFNIFAPISTYDGDLDDDNKSTDSAGAQSYDYSLDSGVASKPAAKEQQQKPSPDLEELARNNLEIPETRPLDLVHQRSDNSTFSSLTDRRSLLKTEPSKEDIPLTIREQVEQYRRAKQAQENRANKGEGQRLPPDISTIELNGNNVDETSLLSDALNTLT